MARANKQTDSSMAEGGRPSVPRTLPPGTFTGQPLPATARLIISSPVANRACFVENPHKRSVCSPVSDDDLAKYQNYNSSEKWYNTLPRKAPPPLETTFDGPDKVEGPRSPNYNALPKSLTAFEFRADDASLNPGAAVNAPRHMKHSASFPVSSHEKDVPSTYGRTWYDGIDANACVVEEAPMVEERPKMSFSSFLREPTNNLSVPPGHRRDSTASTLSSHSSSSGGKKSVSFASLHKNSMSSLATRSSDCSSSVSGDQQIVHHKSSDLTLPEPETVAIIPGGSMKRSTSITETNPQLLRTFSALSSESKETEESKEEQPSGASNPNLSESLKPRAPAKSYSSQRPKQRGRSAMMTTSFVGSEIQTSAEAGSPGTPDNKVEEEGDKQSKDSSVIYAKPVTKAAPSVKATPPVRAVVSYTNSKPVKGGKGNGDPKIIISATNSAKVPKPRAVVSVDAVTGSDVTASGMPTPPGSASSTLSRHTTPPGSNNNSLKRNITPISSAFNSLTRSTPAASEKKEVACNVVNTSKGIGNQSNGPTSTVMPGTGTTPKLQSFTNTVSSSREKPKEVSQKPAVTSGSRFVIKPETTTTNSMAPSAKTSTTNPPLVKAEKTPGSSSYTFTYPSSASVVTSSPAPASAKPGPMKAPAFTLAGSAFATESPKPKPPTFVLPSVRTWAPGASKTGSGNVSGKFLDQVSSRPDNSEGKTSRSGSVSSQSSQQSVSSPTENGTVRRRGSGSGRRSASRQNRWSVSDASMPTDLKALSISSSNLNSSMASLAKSSESLASNSSLAERNRFLKFSFLTSQEDLNSPKLDTNARFEMHKKKLSTSRTSLTSLNSNHGGKSTNLGASKSSLTIEEKNTSPVQGRFVSSLINQFQKPSVESLTSPTTTNSSGLGPSLPGSPDSTPVSPASPKYAENQANVANNNIPNNLNKKTDPMAKTCATNRNYSILQKVQHETSIH